MTAGVYNSRIEQGSRWVRVLTIKDADNVAIDITTWLFYMQIKSNFFSEDVLINLAIDSGIELTDPENGQLTITITDEQSAELTANQKLVYDLFVDDGGSGGLIKYLAGSLTVDPRVTINE